MSRNTRKRAATTIAASLLLGLLPGCGPSPYHSLHGQVMGTYYSMSGDCADQEAFEGAVGALVAIDAEMSTYKPDSGLMRLNRTPAGEAVPISDDLRRVLELSARVRDASGGAFDVAIGALVNAWGFGPTNTGAAPDAQTIERLKPPGDGGYRLLPAGTALRTADEVFLDLSAVAKGYAVDAAAAELRDAGCRAAMVDVGGEVRVFGPGPRGAEWRIGIEVPDAMQVGGVEAVLPLIDAAVATSGDYRNFREVDGIRVSHTIDPRSGRPITHGLASVTVVQPTTADADAWATALDVLGPDDGLALATANGIAVYMLVRTPGGFESRYTPAMAKLMHLP